WCEQAASYQISKVTIAEPGVHHPAIAGFGEGGANAQTDCLDPIAIFVKGCQILAKGLGQSVIAVGAAWRLIVQSYALPMKADYMVGAGKNGTTYALPTHGFIEM